ncbi:MAG: hypothetical protein KDK65_04190 [Chlamydiia bacterium]|nr:hypothetical protein [Chlamydiia bacterium]
MAYLFFQQHDYTGSLAYFQKVSVHDVWSEEMIHFAGEIVGEKDQSPNALSIRLQINQALSKQSTLPGQSHSMPIHSVDSLQRQYTSVSHSVDPAFKLPDHRSSSMTMPGLQIYSFLSFTTYINPNRSWDNHFRKDTGFLWNKSDFEQALVHWIKVAQGGTPDEKRQLRFRLQLMSQCELSETQKSSCELLRRVLLLGEQAPKFPNVTLQNLNECEREGYQTVYPNKIKLEKWVEEVWKLDVPQERVKGQPFVQNGTMKQSITFPLMQTQEVTVAGAVSLSANRSLIQEVKTFVAQPAARWEEALSAKRRGEHANQASFKMGELKGDEKRYERGLQEELKQFQHDYEQGKALNADKMLYTLIDAKVLDKLEQQLSADCEKGEHLLQSCEQQILTLANNKPTHHLREMMLQLGGVEKEVEAEVSVEKKVEQEVLLQAELQNELRGYTKWGYSDHQEVKWKKSGITNFLTKGVGAVPITSLAKALKKYAYKYSYDQIFSSGIQVTDNFRRASKEEISVFDSRQKPAWQILVQKKGGKYTFTLLSLQEAVTFQKWLKTQQQVGLCEDVWLIQPDGTPFVDNPFSVLDPRAIAKLLIEVNVFNGNLSYLERHPEATLALFEEGDYDLKLRFLMLKVFSKSGEETVARRSSLLRILNEKGGKQKIASLVTRVADTESPVTLTLSDKEVENLKHPAFLPHVTPEQINRVPVPFADKLSKKQVAALSNPALLKNLKKEQLPAVAPEQVEHLTDEQLKYLRRQDQVDAIPLKRLPITQVKRLSQKKIPQLRTSSQISQVRPLNVHHLVPKQIKHVTKKEQLEALPLSKIRFVPFRNTGKASFTWRLLHKMVRLTTATWGMTRCTLFIASGLFLFAPFSKTQRRSWNHSTSLISGQA